MQSSTKILPLNYCFNSDRNYVFNPDPGREPLLEWMVGFAKNYSDILIGLLDGVSGIQAINDWTNSGI